MMAAMWRYWLFACVVGCGEETPTPDAGPDRYRVDRTCISSLVSGPTNPGAWDELLITHGCEGEERLFETFQYGPGEIVGLIGTHLLFRFELIRIVAGRIIGIEQSGNIAVVIGPSLRLTRFEHTLDDLTQLDLDGDGALDWVTVGTTSVRRAALMNRELIAAVEEVPLLTGKPFRYIAVAELGGSALPDLFYVTDLGEIGMAIQTSPDVFTAQTLATDPGTPRRLHVADVDGDGRDDVVGAAGHLFVYSSKRGAVALFDEPVHAVSVGDFYDIDGVGEPVFITKDRKAVRRVIVEADGTLRSEPLIDGGGDLMTVGDMDGDSRDDIVLVHDAGTPTSWLRLHRAFTF